MLTRRPESMVCPGCGAHVQVFDERMGVPGGKDREQAYCPACGALVVEMITDGFLRVVLVEIEEG